MAESSVKLLAGPSPWRYVVAAIAVLGIIGWGILNADPQSLLTACFGVVGIGFVLWTMNNAAVLLTRKELVIVNSAKKIYRLDRFDVRAEVKMVDGGEAATGSAGDLIGGSAWHIFMDRKSFKAMGDQPKRRALYVLTREEEHPQIELRAAYGKLPKTIDKLADDINAAAGL